MIDFSVIIGGITLPSRGDSGKIVVFSSDDKNNTPLADVDIELLPCSVQNCSTFDAHLNDRDVIQSSSLWTFSLSHVLTLKEEDKLSKIFSALGADLTTPRLLPPSVFASGGIFYVNEEIETGFYHIGTEEVEIYDAENTAEGFYCEVNRGRNFTRPRHFGLLGSYGMPITKNPIFWIGRDVYIYINKKLFRQGVLAENPKINANEIAFSVAFSDCLLNTDLLGTRQDNVCRLSQKHLYKYQTKQPYIIKKLAGNPIDVTYDQKNGTFVPHGADSVTISSSEILSLDEHGRLPKDYFTETGIFTSDRQQWWTGVSDVGNYAASFHFFIDPDEQGLNWDDFYSESNITQAQTVLQGFSLFWPAPSITIAGGDVSSGTTINNITQLYSDVINAYGVRTSTLGPNYRDFVLRCGENGFDFLSTCNGMADPWIEIGILTEENIPFVGGNPLGLHLQRQGWVASLLNEQNLIQESKSVISDLPFNWRDSNNFLTDTLFVPQTTDYIQPFQGGVGTLTSEVFFEDGVVYSEEWGMYSKNIQNQQSLPKLEIYPWRLLPVDEQIERKWFNSGYLGSEEIERKTVKNCISWFKMPTLRNFSGNGPSSYVMQGFKNHVRFPVPLAHAEKWVNDFEFYLLSEDLDETVLYESDVLATWQELKNGGEFEDFEQRLHVFNRSGQENRSGFFTIRQIAARGAFNYRSFGEWTQQGGAPVSLIPILPVVNTLNNDNINNVLCSVDGTSSNLFDNFVQGFGLDPNNIDTNSFNSFDSNWLKNYDLDQLRQRGFEALEGILHLSSLCIRSISQDGYKLQLASFGIPTINQVKCEFNDENILTFPNNVEQLPVVSQYLLNGTRNNEEISIKVVDGLALACQGTGEEISLDLTLGELSDNIQDNDLLRSKFFACHLRYGEPHKKVSFSIALDANDYFLYLSCGDVVSLNSEILQKKLNISPCLGQVCSVKIDVLKKQALVDVFLWTQSVKGWQPSFKFSHSGYRIHLIGSEQIWDFLPNSASGTFISINDSGVVSTFTATITKDAERGYYTESTSRTVNGYMFFPVQSNFFMFNDVIV